MPKLLCLLWVIFVQEHLSTKHTGILIKHAQGHSEHGKTGEIFQGTLKSEHDNLLNQFSLNWLSNKKAETMECYLCSE